MDNLRYLSARRIILENHIQSLQDRNRYPKPSESLRGGFFFFNTVKSGRAYSTSQSQIADTGILLC